MNDAIKLLENMINNNSVQMRMIAVDYIRTENYQSAHLKEKFKVLENKNLALNEALDILQDALEKNDETVL